MNLFLLLLVFSILVTFSIASFSAAPWVPVHTRDIGRILKLAAIAPGEIFVELGSGDGRTLAAAAHAGARSIGFEISLLPYLISRVRFLFLSSKIRPRIFYKSFWSADLSQADVVYLFLMPKVGEKLVKKLRAELRPGARVITYVWPLTGWTPEKTDVIQNQLALHLHVVPTHSESLQVPPVS